MLNKVVRMQSKVIDNCPLVPNLKICHPSCNFWNGTKCTYTTPVARPNLILTNNKPQEDDELYRNGPMLATRDVARLLNVHANTVRRWSNLGMLKSYRINFRGDRRFKQKEVTRLLKNDRLAGVIKENSG